eukprot:1379209-Ditylum_brightwellii.AAC.1
MLGRARLDPVNAHASICVPESSVISAKLSTPRYSRTLFNLSSVASPGCIWYDHASFAGGEKGSNATQPRGWYIGSICHHFRE